MKNIDELLGVAKLSELMSNDKKDESKKVLWVLAIIGAVAAVAGIAALVYKYLSPDYLEDIDDDYDDDFDDDFFDEEAEEEDEEADFEEEELEIEEPSEEEIQARIKKSKGSGVPFDTGFVVTGRYDLSATSEIGLKAGLTEEQKKL